MEGNARPLRFVIALVATFFVGTTNIQPGDDAASMANALLRQRSSALTEVFIQFVGAIAFLFFLAGISSILRRSDPNARVFAPVVRVSLVHDHRRALLQLRHLPSRRD